MPGEWIGPVFSLVGVGAGWALSLLSQKRQHRLALDQIRLQHEISSLAELHRRGREPAQEALDALRTLEVELPKIVGPSTGKYNKDKHSICDRAFGRLERVILYLPDPSLRSQLDLSYQILQSVDDVSQWGGPDVGWPRQIVYRVCSEAIEALGRYLREEKQVDNLSPKMQLLKQGYELAMDELQAQHEQNEQYMKSQLAKREPQAEIPPSPEAS